MLSQSSKPICKLYYYESSLSPDQNEWDLTTDRRLAERNLNHRVAELDDLNDFGAVGKIIEDKVLHIVDGFIEWNCGDGVNTYGDYVFVDGIRDYVLDRLESIGLNDSELYEWMLGWKDWKIHSWLDMNSYEGILG